MPFGVRLVLAGVLSVLLPGAAATAPLRVVAAENVYGAIAGEIGGDRVTVTSILDSPVQDPHLMEASPAVVRRLADAHLVIINGAGYDRWAEDLLRAAPRENRIVINVAQLAGHRTGDNPHLWYDPAVMPRVARAIADALSAADAAHIGAYGERLQATLAALEKVTARVSQLRAKHAGAPVTATEPVFGLMADALGLVMRNQPLQAALMNHAEPAARAIAAFEDDLAGRKVRVLIHNAQGADRLAARLVARARKAGIPVVAVTEMQPPGRTFADWMLGQLDALDRALTESKP